MSKLEIISELLVNELTDFEKDVNRLEDSIAKAENLQVKFDTKPLEGLISKLQKYGRQEEHSRNEYLQHIQSSLEQAKIYPNWAVITFIVTWTFALGAIFYIYLQASNLEQNKRDAYQLGIQENQQFLIKFFDENPNIRKEYQKWMKNN